MRIRTALVAVALASSAPLVSAGGVASAATPACDPPTSTNLGEFCLYYNSYLGGSLRDFDTAVSDFAGYTFRTPGAGYGQAVKNNAASAWNRDPFATVRVYYNRNYMGPADDVRPKAWRNLADTKNDNASFRWLSN